LANDLLIAAFLLWATSGVIALIGRGLAVARLALMLGALVGIAAALLGLPGGTSAMLVPTELAGQPVAFQMAPDALWLMGFGLAPAVLAGWLATPARGRQASWLFGAAMSLIGALGVFGLQDGAAFLVAWEIMSFGSAIMILGEALSPPTGRPVLFMLALLEIGAVALLLAILLLGGGSEGFSFAGFSGAAAALPGAVQIFVGVLIVIGFGVKLGLLPFYEWFPAAYGAGSGASGALLSGVVLNAAFFGLSRGLLNWVPGPGAIGATGLGIFVVVLAVLSAILSALYAFQQDDWRGLLSFSTAENASIATALLGAALMFRGDRLPELAGLAWTVALLHLAAHSLAKGGLFLAADGVFRATGDYAIVHTDLVRRSSWLLGVGALFAAMSLAAMPPQAGFVSEWYMFQTVFQGFHLGTLGTRLVLALAGAGLALTAAIAFATFIKVFGVGLLGRALRPSAAVPFDISIAAGLLGFGVLVLAVGMPYWLGTLGSAVSGEFDAASVERMQVGWVLVPATGHPIRLTGTFAFISPSLLAIVMPLLALIPLMLLLSGKRFTIRRAPVWYGGLEQDPDRASTTGLAFSNALRTFYSFIYRPTEETIRETNGHRYFIRRLVFSHEVAPIFGPFLFSPATRIVQLVAERLRALQSGQLSFYLSMIGALLVIILALTLS
jgi:hydrogenase-4 component B